MDSVILLLWIAVASSFRADRAFLAMMFACGYCGAGCSRLLLGGGRGSVRWLWNQLGPALLVLRIAGLGVWHVAEGFCFFVLLVSEQEQSAVVPCRATVGILWVS
ncbi:hypothetical protein Nepgr_023921 [Nepenthes gracilis]|uniref:Uncharacterized protein n=1 Tax=Nepenthes gracilis TaxID=150966 RepID=A0AAD3XYA5_NEPGR|nr:hypothetical protein Nepgr_023921 [Nepenthes gracilis]